MMTNQQVDEFLEDRRKAITAGIKDDDMNAVKAYLRKYGEEIPEEDTVLKLAIYKVAQGCADIPRALKMVAMFKAYELGVSPAFFERR